MQQKSVSTLVMLLIIVGSAACSPRQVGPTPTITIEATANAGIGSAGGSAGAEEQAAGGFMAPGTSEDIEDWWGVIRSTGTGAEYDDCFERQDLGQVIYFGIDSMDPALRAQIEELRDSGRIVHLHGRLLSNVPDCNGSQIQVDRIEVDE